VAAQLAASQEGLSSMSDYYYYYHHNHHRRRRHCCCCLSGTYHFGIDNAYPKFVGYKLKYLHRCDIIVD
jgi:hypothetical protein